MSLLQTFKDFCRLQGHKKTYWLALSGGLDSQVLLLLAQQWREQENICLRAIHINHGLSPHAKSWEEACALLCKTYAIDLVIHRLNLSVKPGDSIEALAREARYQAFASYLDKADLLLSAHHQDDQAETVLMQLFRGAGLKGLAAMPPVKTLGQGMHVRPLLSVTKKELQAYALTHGLQWIDDEMNQEEKFTRGFIRHQVLPILNNRWPSLGKTLTRSAQHCADAQMLLDEFAMQMLATVRGLKPDTLSVAKLLTLSAQQQQLMLRTWIYQAGYRLPETKKLLSILQTVLKAAWDRRPCVTWDEVELRRHKDDLYLLKKLVKHDRNRCRTWQLEEMLLLPGIGYLRAELQANGLLSKDIHKVDVKFRQGGEIVSLGVRGHRKLKNLFQEWQVLPWERDRIPLIFVEEELIAIPGYFLDERFKSKENEIGWQLYW